MSASSLWDECVKVHEDGRWEASFLVLKVPSFSSLSYNNSHVPIGALKQFFLAVIIHSVHTRH